MDVKEALNPPDYFTREQLAEARAVLAAEVVRLREERRWIPCSEKLPSDDDSYLVRREHGPFTPAVEPFVQSFKCFLLDIDDDSNPVTHWMPLPEGPGGDG